MFSDFARAVIFNRCSVHCTAHVRTYDSDDFITEQPKSISHSNAEELLTCRTLAAFLVVSLPRLFISFLHSRNKLDRLRFALFGLHFRCFRCLIFANAHTNRVNNINVDKNSDNRNAARIFNA